jgi:hypothetical protein
MDHSGWLDTFPMRVSKLLLISRTASALQRIRKLQEQAAVANDLLAGI